MPPKKARPALAPPVKVKEQVVDSPKNESDSESEDEKIDESADLPDLDDDDVSTTDTIKTTTDPIIISSKERYEFKPTISTEIVFVSPENRITSEFMTRFECTEITSHRAKQIENGCECFTDVSNLSDPLEMARKELNDRRCPLDIVRMLTDRVAERWHANEMVIPANY
jgi:DNA-directed RNA polymerase I, II, and III subunit RPABC2